MIKYISCTPHGKVVVWRAQPLRMTEEGSGETRTLNLSQGQKSRPGQSNCNDGIM